MNIQEKLNLIDEELRDLEDISHGEVGTKITKLRVKLLEIILNYKKYDNPHKLTKILTEYFKHGNLLLIKDKLYDNFIIYDKEDLCNGDDIPKYRIKNKEDLEVIKDVLYKNGFRKAGLLDALYLWEKYLESLLFVKLTDNVMSS